MLLDSERWLELRRFRGLLESGALRLSEIARETGLDRKTVRKYLSSPGPATPPRWKGRSKPRRQDRRWATSWSPQQISHRLKADFQLQRWPRQDAFETLWTAVGGRLRT